MDSEDQKTDLKDKSTETSSEFPPLEASSNDAPSDTKESPAPQQSAPFTSERPSYVSGDDAKKEVKPTLLSRLPRPHLSNGDGKLAKVATWLRHYWWLVVLIVIIVGGLIGWRAYGLYIDGQWNKASDYYGRADYSNAAKILDKMSIPKDDKRLTVYAQTMLATRQLDKALPAYQALYTSKKDPATKLIIGNIYNEQKKYDESASTYNDLIASNAAYVQAYVNLSTLYKLQGKDDDAVSVAKKGVAANPSSAVLYELLISMLLDKKDSADYQNAVASLKKLNPQDPIFQTIDE